MVLLSSESETDKIEAFLDLKSVFCRDKANTGERFRFGPRRIRTLCAIYHPGCACVIAPSTPELKSIPISPDFTNQIVRVVRVLRTGSIEKISVMWANTCRVENGDEVSTSIINYNVAVVLNSRFVSGGRAGQDYKDFHDALDCIGCSEVVVPSFTEMGLKFSLNARWVKDRDGCDTLNDLDWNGGASDPMVEVTFT
jgi:hypothetical protein